MSELDYLGKSADALGTDFTRAALNLFAEQYNKGKDEWFSEAHALGEHEYDKSSYKRVGFHCREDMALFVQDMREQGIDVVATPFQLNGQYLAEISVVQDDGRNADDVIEDFKSRTYAEPQAEQQQGYERAFQQHDYTEGVMDFLVTNHLDSLGTAIHKIQQASVLFGEGQYGQTSNDDIFHSGLTPDGSADPTLSSGNSKVATVLNDSVVVIDGKVVEDERIRRSVLEQHRERMEHAEQILDDLHGQGLTRTEKRHLDDAAGFVNHQAELVENYEKMILNNESLSPEQFEDYQRAQQTVAAFESDMSRVISKDCPVTAEDMQKFNETILSRAESAGLPVRDGTTGVFDTSVWKGLSEESAAALGISDASKALVYSINADAKQLTVEQSNAAAIYDAAYRQDYAVTTSSCKTQTVEDPNTIFGVWSTGALGDLANRLNEEQISRDVLTQAKMQSFSIEEAEYISAALARYNDAVENGSISGLLDDLIASSDISEAERDFYSSVNRQISENPQMQHKDLLDEKTAGAFVAQVFEPSKRELVNSLLASSPQMESALKSKGITVDDLIHNTNGVENKLKELLSSSTDKVLKKNLTNLQEQLSALNGKEQSFRDSFDDKIRESVVGKTKTLDDLLDTNGSGTAANLLLSQMAAERLNSTALDKSVAEELRKQLNGDNIRDLLNNSDIAAAAAKEIVDRKRKEFFDANPQAMAMLTAAGIDVKKLTASELQEKLGELLKKTASKLHAKKPNELKLRNAKLKSQKVKTPDLSLTLSEKIRLTSHVQKAYDKMAAEEAQLRRSIEDHFTLSENEIALVRKANGVFSLNNRELGMLSGSSELLRDLQNITWIKSVNFASGKLSAEDLLNINADFLKFASKQGYNFVNRTGFDIKMLKGLNDKDLEKLGITRKVRDALVDINQKGSFGKLDQLKGLYGGISKGVGFFIRNVDGGEGFQDISELVNYTSKGVQYTYNAIVSIRRLQNISISDLANLRRKGGLQNLKDKWNKQLPKKTVSKPPKPVRTRPMTEKEIQRQAKYAENLKKKLAKTERGQKSLWSKANRQLAALKKRVAESAIGKAITAVTTAVKAAVSTFLAYYFGAAAVLALFVQVAALVAVLVICLVDTIKGAFNVGNWFAPQTYEDTVAWQLYQNLLDREDEFVAELANTPTLAYDQRNSINYGFEGENLQTYLTRFDNLTYVTDNGGDIRINPFWRDDYVTATVNPDYMTSVNQYDGIHTYDISTNLNYFNVIEDPDADDTAVVYGVSNGHTSNIKDIMAMTDIMYQMEATDSDDENMTSVLGMSAAQLNTKAVFDYIGYGFKVVGEFFKNLWEWLTTGDSSWEISEMEVNGVTYRTIQNYAYHLFQVSHQQYLYLNVQYCDINKKIYNYDGSELTLSPESRVNYGICPSPVTNSFRVMLDKTHGLPYKPEPYVERDDGSIKLLNATNSDGTPYFDICISVEDNLVPAEVTKVCLWDDMPTESDVYKGHTYCTTSDTVWNRIKSNNCWKKATETSSTEYLYSTKWGGWSSSRSAANTSAKNAVKTDLQNQFTASPRESSYYIINEDVAIAYIYEYEYKLISNTISDTEYFKVDASDTNPYRSEATGKARLYTLKVITYTRECKGHAFQYCGGHICTHEQGNVFSVTNEQLSLTDMYEEGNEPLSLNVEFHDAARVTGSTPYSGSLYSQNHTGVFEFDRRYTEIQGKVITSEIDYSTPYQASVTGGGLTPLQDIYQGTAVSHGLNLLINPDGTWGKGEAITSADCIDYVKTDDAEALTSGLKVLGGQVRYCRDIFDCDCIILKGCNIFPFKDFTKYEGWNADNMTLVINRVGMDWYDLYGFDMATEIGEYNFKLSELDKEMLIVGLQNEYGAAFTSEREEIVNALLSFVGRGHYTMHHHPLDYSTNYTSSQLENANHGYLSYLCNATNYVQYMGSGSTEVTNKVFSASCSAGNSIDIGSYAMNYIGKKYGRAIGGCYSEIEAYTLTQFLPADVITHSGYDLDAHNNRLDVNLTGTIDGELLQNFHLKNQAVMFVGTFSDSSIIKMKQFLAEKLDAEEYAKYTIGGVLHLTTMQSITSGTPICVDLNQMGIYSGLRLRSEGVGYGSLTDYLPNYFTGGERKADSAYANSALQTTYYWLIHPDDRTKNFNADRLINPSW